LTLVVGTATSARVSDRRRRSLRKAVHGPRLRSLFLGLTRATHPLTHLLDDLIDRPLQPLRVDARPQHADVQRDRRPRRRRSRETGDGAFGRRPPSQDPRYPIAGPFFRRTVRFMASSDENGVPASRIGLEKSSGGNFGAKLAENPVPEKISAPNWQRILSLEIFLRSFRGQSCSWRF